MARLAGRQHGVVARRQLMQIGLGRHAIAGLLQRGRLHVVHRGVYAVGHRRLTRHGRWLAAILAAGDGAVLSGRSAAALWGMRDSSRDVIEITAPREVRRPWLRVSASNLPPDERDTHEGIPVTTPARTLVDLAGLLDAPDVARAAERAEALRLGSPTTLQELTTRYPTRKGIGNIKRLIEEDRIVPTDTRSTLERRFLSLLDANDLPRPLVNERLGPITPDLRWTEQRLIVELDGFETHGTRNAYERDRARGRALTVQGWRVVRVTKRQLDDDPHAIAAELRALLRLKP